ncbi:MAG: lantibiotic immunity ABC transporter MutE/EpiE family permease subunit [Clostridium sp.]
MFNMIQAELLKFKGTFSKKLAFIAPMYVLVYSLFMNRYFFQSVINWWSVAIMPFIIAILCLLTSLREKKAGKYRTLKSKDINIKKMWISKIIVIGGYSLMSTIIFIFNIVIVELIFQTSQINMLNAVWGLLIIWLTTLILIPICLFISEKFGTFMIIAISTLGIAIEVFITLTDKWFLWPWSISMRLMCPILKIHPNGCLLEVGDPLLDSSVISVGIIVSIIGVIIFTLITSIWFLRREEK